MKLIITFDPINGLAIPDGKVKAYVNHMVNQTINATHSQDFPLSIGTESIITEFRVALSKGQLPLENIEIWYA